MPGASRVLLHLGLAAMSLLLRWTPLAEAVYLSADTPIVVSEADLELHPSLRLALTDFKRDFYAVLGAPPVFLTRPPPASASAVVSAVYVGTLDGAAWIDEAINSSTTACAETDSNGALLLRADDETHCVALLEPFPPAGGGGSTAVLIAAGSGVRGAIFGLYALSELVFGVQPMHFFADLPPPLPDRPGPVRKPPLATKNLQDTDGLRRP